MMNFLADTRKSFLVVAGAVFMMIAAAPFFVDGQAINSSDCNAYTNTSNFPQESLENYGAPYTVDAFNQRLLVSVQCFNSSEVDIPYIVRAGGFSMDSYVWKTGYVLRLSDDYKDFLREAARFGSVYEEGNRECYFRTRRSERREECINKDNRFEWQSFTFNDGSQADQQQSEDNSAVYSECIERAGNNISRDDAQDISDCVDDRAETVDTSPQGDWIQGQAYQNVSRERYSYYNDRHPTYFLAYVCTREQDGFQCGCKDGEECDETGYWQIQKEIL